MRHLLLVALCVSVPACSFSGVTRRPAKDPGKRPVACTESMDLPNVDLAVGLISLGLSALTIGAAGSGNAIGSGDDSAELNAAFGVASGIVSVPFLISSLYGYRATSRCRELNASSPPPRA